MLGFVDWLGSIRAHLLVFVFSHFFLGIVAALYTLCIPFFIYYTSFLSIKKKLYKCIKIS